MAGGVHVSVSLCTIFQQEGGERISLPGNLLDAGYTSLPPPFRS